MNKPKKHYFTSFLSFFHISAEETGRNRFFQAEKTVEKTMVFSTLEETGEPCPVTVQHLKVELLGTPFSMVKYDIHASHNSPLKQGVKNFV